MDSRGLEGYHKVCEASHNQWYPFAEYDPDQLHAVISIFDPYISLNKDGIFVLNLTRELKNRVTLDMLLRVEKALEIANSMNVGASIAKSGYVNIDQDHRTIIAYSKNYQGIKMHWWGAEVWLNNETCNRITSGGNFAGILSGFIPDAAIKAALVITLGLCIWKVDSCNAAGNGIYFQYSYATGALGSGASVAYALMTMRPQ